MPPPYRSIVGGTHGPETAKEALLPATELPHPPGPPPYLRSRHEPVHPAAAILDVAEEKGADLIVVGNKGMTGARRFLLGSVPNKVSHHAPCNVMIVRTT